MESLANLPDVWLAAVGPQNAKYTAKLLDHARQLGVEARFSMLPPVPPGDVVDYIADADFGVNPLIPATLSYQYAMPNKLFEMAFAGLPIVNSDAQESARFVRTHGLGVIFRSGDSADCAKAMALIARDPASFRQSSEDLSRLCNTYGWHSQTRKLASLYDRIGQEEPKWRTNTRSIGLSSGQMRMARG